MSAEQRLKLAVFIDFDNIEIGVKTTLNQTFDIGAVLEAVKERGEVITKVAYGDWKRSGDHGRAMAQHAVRMVQRVMTPGGDKNGADINLALDALEMAFTHAHINAFVIVGGDSDFITLVEKLKQYDRKVFVIGGRAFTSQVMQKNCTEFIAYENVVQDPSTGAASSRAPSRDARGRQPRQARGDRPRANGAGTQSIEQAVPLVTRALKILIDREVSPQLGLLKSTLLQLDSSFSERDYGVSTFREFADKLAEHGLVALKQQGRSTLVELPSTPMSPQADSSSLRAGPSAEDGEMPTAAETPLREILEQPDSAPAPAEPIEVSLGDGVALVRRALAEATTPPRWPMYPRQFKQFLKNAQPDFEERRYGSINDLMRACQKDGLVRLERDRQGGLRVFASNAPARASVPHGWGLSDYAHDDSGELRRDLAEAAYGRGGGHHGGGNGHANGNEPAPEQIASPEEPVAEVIAEAVPPSASARPSARELRRDLAEAASGGEGGPVIEAQVTAVIEEPIKPKRVSRARKTPPEKKKSVTPRKKKQGV
jgi:uncharacterized LabA/DUF88 family protein